MSSGRPLVRPGLIIYAQAFAEARANLVASLNELAELHAELEGMRAEIAELRAIALDVVRSLRERADQDVDQLRRRLATALLRLAQRDEHLPLH